jgi:hypothetical protein
MIPIKRFGEDETDTLLKNTFMKKDQGSAWFTAQRYGWCMLKKTTN